jgi:hypothetical protein
VGRREIIDQLYWGNNKGRDDFLCGLFKDREWWLAVVNAATNLWGYIH